MRGAERRINSCPALSSREQHQSDEEQKPDGRCRRLIGRRGDRWVRARTNRIQSEGDRATRSDDDDGSLGFIGASEPGINNPSSSVDATAPGGSTGGFDGTTEEERIPYPPRWLLVDRGVLPRTARRQNPSSQGPMESLGARSAVAPVAARAPVRAAKPARGVVVARARAAHDNKDASSSPADDIAKSAVAGACRAALPSPRRGNGSEPRKERVARDESSSRPASPTFGLLAARARDRAIRTRGARPRRARSTSRNDGSGRIDRPRSERANAGDRSRPAGPSTSTHPADAPPSFPST